MIDSFKLLSSNFKNFCFNLIITKSIQKIKLIFDSAAGAVMAQGPVNAVHSPEAIVNDYPAAELSEKQIADLEFMYEEEKLARDLYARLGEEWNLPAFANISRSEAQHMAALEALFTKYDLEKPAAAAGEYNNGELVAAAVKELKIIRVKREI